MKKTRWTTALVCCALLMAMIPAAAADELPTAIRLNRVSATIGIDSVNKTLDLYIDGASYASGSGPIPLGVTWTASDPAMVALTPNPSDPSKCTVTATAASAGTCTITARVGMAAASCTVTVKGLFKAKTLKIGGAKTIKLGSDKTRNRLQLVAKITPAHASANDPFRELVNWKSLNKKIATVDDDGWVQALKPGTVRIVCSLGDGSKKKVGVNIKVTKLTPQSIAIKDQVLPMLRSFHLDYELVPDNAYDQRIAWKTSDRFVAQVASDGTVRGLKPGRVTISATTVTGKKKASCTVTIVEALAPTPAPSPSPSATPAPDETPSPSATPTVSPSPTPTPPPKYRVHAFGNGAYQPSTNLGTLASAATDAEAFGSLYAEAKFPDGGIAVTVHKDKTAAKMREAFRAMATADGLDRDSVTIIYYQGHAASSVLAYNHGALLGVDGLLITVSELREMLDGVPGTVVLILDCSFSGRYLEEAASASGGSALVKAVAQTFKADKYKVLCGCSATGYVLDTGDADSQTSVMMTGIRAGLSGASMPADTDRNKLVTVDELYTYVRASVNAFVAEMNKTGRNLEQTVIVWPANDRMTVYAK